MDESVTHQSIDAGVAPPQPRTVLVGAETLLVECAALLRQAGHRIVAVLAPPGPAAQWAEQEGLLCAGHHSVFDVAQDGGIDYLFSITNLTVLPPELIALPRRAAINFHDGPLPAYAGLNVPVWALLAGEKSHGVTWHHMTAVIDGGAIVASERFAIDAGETALSLNTKCFEAGLRSFAALVERLPAGDEPVPAGEAPKRRFARSDRPACAATIDWARPAQDIARLVAALDFGGYANPLACPKAMTPNGLVLVRQVEIAGPGSGHAPGTVLEDGAMPVIATASDDIRLVRVTDLAGAPIDPGLVAGQRLLSVDPARGATLAALDGAAAMYEPWWRERLARAEATRLPQLHAAAMPRAPERVDQRLNRPHGPDRLRAATIALLARLSGRGEVAVGHADPVYRSRLDGVAPWFTAHLPLDVVVDDTLPLAWVMDAVAAEMRKMNRRVAISADMAVRYPELSGRALARPIAIEMVDGIDDTTLLPDVALQVVIPADGRTIRWQFDAAQIDDAAVRDLTLALEVLLDEVEAAPDTPVAALPLLSLAERDALAAVSAGARVEVGREPIHHLFVEQARRTPQRIAVTSRGRSLSYGELDARSSRLARHLIERGVGPDVLVGLHLTRSVDLVVAMLGIHKAGGAYVPLDPAYPADRLAHMMADAELAVIVTEAALAEALPETSAQVVRVDADHAAIDCHPAGDVDGGARGENLAYVIYTSGSTGLPKGVMVEHRNVRNFFAGMDRALEPDGTWLAVTSPSFDISVLELCWPLTRGYHVVIATENEVRGDVRAAAPRIAGKAPGFSLFYFASAQGETGAEQYRLLLEGAKFADNHGFEAVWTPERHFHAFGGLYPNPSVISAAIAATTSRVKIRAGSCVAPLHHPARIAEEWGLVDNLSNGRVGIAFASGWQPDDFLLRPDNFADKQGALVRTIDDVRALWRGERRSFPGPLGTPVEIGTFPRPVQPELPFWITSAGNPETFAAAGRAGANLLTHLLGQSAAEVGVKLDAYRRAWRAAGHAGEGHVTMMLHSFVGADLESVRAIVREPLIDYLRSSASLIKQYAWSFPAFRRPGEQDAADLPDLSELSAAETDALLDHAFERYFETSGLFGPPERCLDLIERLRDVGVDEFGCLIDFGVPTQTVLDHLPQLDRLRAMACEAGAMADEAPLAELIARHGVTHLQCTPSLLRMLADDVPSRAALAGLTRLMVGGEPFPAPLAQDMTALVRGKVMNMYGPTETTIWSAVHVLDPGEAGSPPLGTPLCSQQLHVVDAQLRPVRPGMPGELLIGGDGVVRGYLNRAALTAERFVDDPFMPGGRAYRTGDLVQRTAEGRLTFLGRTDHQIKIRGYRVELGEIETLLLRQPGIAETVVVAREEAGVVRLIAYHAGAAVPVDALRAALRASLPDFMVPGQFVALQRLPRTPNGKIDRNALPDPVAAERPMADIVPILENPLQQTILAVWRDVLKIERVGLRDNFFDLGGHSLLAVQAHRRLAAAIDRPLTLTDIFRFPTIEALSAHLAGDGGSGATRPGGSGQDRARSRRLAIQRRATAGAVTAGTMG